MTYIISMTPPNGTPEYFPRDFGFGVHQHTLDITEAEQFPTPEKALQRLNGYRWPNAFWESEKRHAEAMKKKFKDWVFLVIPA